MTTLLANLDEEFRNRRVVTGSTGTYGRTLAQVARWFNTGAVVAVALKTFLAPGESQASSTRSTVIIKSPDS